MNIIKYLKPELDKVGHGPQTSENNNSNGFLLECSTKGKEQQLDFLSNQELHLALLQLFQY